MPNLKILETFRTKEELINYFKSSGENITEDEIDCLKKIYKKAKRMIQKLTLSELGEVVVGLITLHIVEGEEDYCEQMKEWRRLINPINRENSVENEETGQTYQIYVEFDTKNRLGGIEFEYNGKKYNKDEFGLTDESEDAKGASDYFINETKVYSIQGGTRTRETEEEANKLFDFIDEIFLSNST